MLSRYLVYIFLPLCYYERKKHLKKILDLLYNKSIIVDNLNKSVNFIEIIIHKPTFTKTNFEEFKRFEKLA